MEYSLGFWSSSQECVQQNEHATEKGDETSSDLQLEIR